jgi:hypothetical protein
MPSPVSDFGSNVPENIEHWAKTLGRSILRRKVFNCIYSGKKRKWTAGEIMHGTKLRRVAVLNEGKKLAANGLVHESKSNGKVVYEKDDRVHHHKKAIIRFADSAKARASIVTKRRPAGSLRLINIRVAPQRARARQISIDDIDSFSRAHNKTTNSYISRTVSESQFRDGVKAILGELGHFADWGGEQHDLFSTKVRVKGKRLTAAFAFKGPATKGILTPGKCGRNGDQIQRLLESPASVFLFQYHGQISPSVLTQMRTHAMLHSVHSRQEVLYGVIDGEDSQRLLLGYSKAFARAGRRTGTKLKLKIA